ncbi:MAG: SH3 domain-containing protein [Anaerolineales bacterium]
MLRVNLFLVLLLFLAACAPDSITPGAGVALPSATFTLSPYPTLVATFAATPSLSPSTTPAAAIQRGRVTTRLNVRKAPNSAAEILGILETQAEVEILAQDPSHTWFLIVYPGPEGKGWISSAYVEGVEKEAIPPLREPLGLVTQPLNIRSGPGTSFNSLGMLKAGDLVKALGKDEFGAWIQIEYADGPQGVGWVNAAFLRLENADRLPILSASGMVIGTGTPPAATPTATPTLIPALLDQDSAAAPLWEADFSAFPPHQIVLEDEVSSPQGDGEDWVQVIPPESFPLQAQLTCLPQGDVRIERWEDGKMKEQLSLRCNGENILLSSNAPFLLRIVDAGPGNVLHFTHYRLVLRLHP